MLQTLTNVKSNLKSALTRNPNSDLAVSFVKITNVISELKYLQKDINELQKYAEKLEGIINAVNVDEHQRILIDSLVKVAKEPYEKGD